MAASKRVRRQVDDPPDGGEVPARALRTPALLAWLRLGRVSRKIGRTIGAQVRQAGLTQAQFTVLARVGAAEGVAQQELAAALAVTEGNVVQLLDKMEGARLVCRRQEGRANRLYLTEQGRALFDRVVPAHEALVADQFAGLSPERQVQLHRLLRDLDRSLDAGGPAGADDAGGPGGQR